jgi:hypothetical protein
MAFLDHRIQMMQPTPQHFDNADEAIAISSRLVASQSLLDLKNDLSNLQQAQEHYLTQYLKLTETQEHDG